MPMFIFFPKKAFLSHCRYRKGWGIKCLTAQEMPFLINSVQQVFAHMGIVCSLKRSISQVIVCCIHLTSFRDKAVAALRTPDLYGVNFVHCLQVEGKRTKAA